MGDLIRRTAAIEISELLFKELSKDTVDMMSIGYNCAIADIIANLKNMPSAQQIVRCVDCKSHRLCAIEHEVLRESGDIEFFCKWGERRTDDL